MLEPVSIVIAEDNESLRKYIHALAKHCGKFRVAAEACDGAEAVEVTLNAEPDVVLMDVEMPEMDGIEAVRRLRQHGCNTPVLMFTSVNDHRKVAEALAAGADGYLVKGAPNSEVVKAIEHVAKERELWVDKRLSAMLQGLCAKVLEVDEETSAPV
jgi:two-component system nitrate/nitrite response regulator NarL